MNTLLETVDRMRGKTALVLGDPIIDVYHFGSVDRLCPEAPVPVFVEERREERKGGALNVLANLRALGLDTYGWLPHHPYEEKHRYMAEHHLLLRVDNGMCYTGTEPTLPALPKQPDVCVVSDYAKGWVTSWRCAQLAFLHAPIVVDPKGMSWHKYIGATLLCPNARELEEAIDYSLNIPVLEKRGAEGAVLHRFNGDDTAETFPATPVRVYDVTGAGDVVTAVMAAAIAAAATLSEAARLAMLAASWSVSQIGTVVVSNAKLKELVCEQSS